MALTVKGQRSLALRCEGAGEVTASVRCFLGRGGLEDGVKVFGCACLPSQGGGGERTRFLLGEEGGDFVLYLSEAKMKAGSTSEGDGEVSW